MNKEKILESSRKENKNRDLVELEVAARAGHIAGRVGAAVCVLLSLVVRLLTDSYLLSPWIIYFSIIATHSLVKYARLRRKTDLVLSLVYLGGQGMNDNELKLKNNLKEARTEKKLSQTQLAEMVGVSRNTISSIETGQFNPTAKLALILCIALDKKFEEMFYF